MKILRKYSFTFLVLKQSQLRNTRGRNRPDKILVRTKIGHFIKLCYINKPDNIWIYDYNQILRAYQLPTPFFYKKKNLGKFIFKVPIHDRQERM